MVLEESHRKLHEKFLKLDSCIHDQSVYKFQSVYLIITCENSHPLLPARKVFREKEVCDLLPNTDETNLSHIWSQALIGLISNYA